MPLSIQREATSSDRKKVGVRDFKAHLSAYVERAANGEPIVITDRGRPVAMLTPLAGDPLVGRLIDDGLAISVNGQVF
ncbi:type II toxin-antitoxin system Phd/YefM family antitoxin [Gephyromycinifex aptenodytis]|uniref:type II toxin-antitoxin system Phd/YefM family antitoxin n=1 Tax=Gephyromycinifex aptenodytis TaxID=2716227 RepID=UPI0014480FCC|nr:type II toxin-antitoxin system prevent-host-death family antitoxin [Gephyromycinifex aptenodytis]